MTKRKITHYVYSTLSASMDYTTYAKGGADLPAVAGNVRIEGGANIPDKFMRTPLGVANGVTDDELEQLMANEVFKAHIANGFITVRDDKVDPEVAAADMEGRDASAPLVDQDFAEPPVAASTDDDKPTNRRRA